MDFEDDDGDADDEESAGGVEGVKQFGVVGEERAEGRGGEGDGSLIRKDGQGGEEDAGAEGFGEGHGGEAIHNGFEHEDARVVVQSVFQGADDGHRADAEEEGARDEAFAEAVGLVGFGVGDGAFGKLSDGVEEGLEAQKHADGVAEDEREEDHADLLGDVAGAGVAEGFEGCGEAGVNDEHPEDALNAKLDMGFYQAPERGSEAATEQNRACID